MKKIIIGLYLLVLGCLLPVSSLCLLEQTDELQQLSQLSLKDVLSVRIRELIQNTQNIPGLTATELSILKDDICNAWNILDQDSVLEVCGTDQKIRPSFVALQGIIEQALANELRNNIKTLNGFIHTPMPATPLCTRGEISPELVDRSIEVDLNRLFTVKARATIIRDYLFQKGNLHIVYPQAGLLKRTEEQQKIYKEELDHYPSHLFDVPLACESIPPELIGATYIFQDFSGNFFVFAIKMTQAKDPQDMGTFGLWFGSMNHAAIKQRVTTLSEFLKKNDLRSF